MTLFQQILHEHVQKCLLETCILFQHRNCFKTLPAHVLLHCDSVFISKKLPGVNNLGHADNTRPANAYPLHTLYQATGYFNNQLLHASTILTCQVNASFTIIYIPGGIVL